MFDQGSEVVRGDRDRVVSGTATELRIPNNLPHASQDCAISFT
jgi:hypothetical protein